MKGTHITHRCLTGAAIIVALGFCPGPAAASLVDQDDQAVAVTLTSSAYPAVPADLARLWLVPDAATRARASRTLHDLADAVRLYDEGNDARALPLVTRPALLNSDLGAYAQYYKGLILLRMGRNDEARQVFAEVHSRAMVGFLSEAARLREADAAQAQGDAAAAVNIYEDLSASKTASPDGVLLALAHAAVAAGDRARAARAYTRLYYDYPLSDLSAAAATELEGLSQVAGLDPATRYRMDAMRAQRLFDNRRYAAAEPAFESLVAQATTADDRERFTLRRIECRFYLHMYRDARDWAQPLVEHASRKFEAQFFYLSAVRELGNRDEYLRLARQLVADGGTSSWVEETLNNLASHFIVDNDDEQADQAFRQLYARFPRGHYAERAAWKIGWWAYKHGKYADTVRFFENTAASFPHSDYRPAFLYWAARAHEAQGEPEMAEARYHLVLTDYRNTYYGRLTVRRYNSRGVALPPIEPVAIVDTGGTPAAPPGNAEQIRLLLALDLRTQAMDELRYAQRTWGDSAVIGATMAWVHNQDGALRDGITAMKRAYPQYMASGGDRLPVELRKVMYPVQFWTEIKRQAATKQLDPYLVAALILQESTFEAEAKSAANAIGLMQIVSSTGRHYASSLRLRRFSPAMLTKPDTNLRLGTAYYSDLVHRFGGDHLALASYNAGENRVAQWLAERPGLSPEEFIDDIPFPETQNYVKRILGAVDDYRALYGDGDTAPKNPVAKKAPAKAGKATSSKGVSKTSSGKSPKKSI